MMKRILAVGAAALLTVMQMTGCGRPAEAAVHNDDLTGKKFAIILKSAGNENMKIMTEGFREVMEESGAEVIVKEPSFATGDQGELVASLISQKVSGICIAANDPDTFTPYLADMKGIDVIAFDSALNADSRNLFVNQTDVEELGKALADAVCDCAGGEGQWAILSTTNSAPNQNAWIDAIMENMEKSEKYSDLTLVDIVYGNDDPDKSAEEAGRLLEQYPDLKVICSPTTIGMLACAKVLSESGSEVKLTGLGLPAEMKPYIGDSGKPCPYMYFWDTENLGKLTAYAAQALEKGEITGAAGESFAAGDLGTFTIEEAGDGGTQVILGPPVRYDEKSIP